MATLAGEPVPSFVEETPKARKVVIACVTGLGMLAADACVTAGVSYIYRHILASTLYVLAAVCSQDAALLS